MTTEIERLEELLEKANQGFRESYSATMQLAWAREASRLRDALAKARRREANSVMSSTRSESE